MRIRSIKPEFYRSEDVARMDWQTRLVFIGLWSYVDDNGVGRDVERLIVADIFPLELDPTETLRRVSQSLSVLESGQQIIRYSHEGKPLLFIANWDRHQLVKNPNNPRNPRPDAAIRASAAPLPTTYGEPTENLPTGTGEQRNRGTGEQGIKDMLTGSAVERVIDAEVIEDEPKPKTKVDPDRFEEFYAAYPRKMGKQKAVAKFKAAVKRASAQEIIDGAHRLANDPNLPEQTYIPHPTTWLERNGWEDEALPMRFRTSSDERLAVGMELAARAANRPKMINPFEN